jgi:hypothetical protein
MPTFAASCRCSSSSLQSPPVIASASTSEELKVEMGESDTFHTMASVILAQLCGAFQNHRSLSSLALGTYPHASPNRATLTEPAQRISAQGTALKSFSNHFYRAKYPQPERSLRPAEQRDVAETISNRSGGINVVQPEEEPAIGRGSLENGCQERDQGVHFLISEDLPEQRDREGQWVDLCPDVFKSGPCDCKI